MLGTKLKELDVVELTTDLPEYGLNRGERGVIVEAFEEPEEAYILEFVDEAGASSKFVDWATPDQIRLIYSIPEEDFDDESVYDFEGSRQFAPVGEFPRFTEHLLYLALSKHEREAIVGDLLEEYSEIRARFGPQKANFWFYRQVFSSMLPLIRRSLPKLIRPLYQELKSLPEWHELSLEKKAECILEQVEPPPSDSDDFARKYLTESREENLSYIRRIIEWYEGVRTVIEKKHKI